MAQQIDYPALIETLVAFGVFSTIAAGIRWLFSGRKRERVDNARIVQGMAMDLVSPLHAEAALLRTELGECRTDMGALRLELEQVLSYAILCHQRLIGDPDAPVPPPIVLRRVV